MEDGKVVGQVMTEKVGEPTVEGGGELARRILKGFNFASFRDLYPMFVDLGGNFVFDPGRPLGDEDPDTGPSIRFADPRPDHAGDGHPFCGVLREDVFYGCVRHLALASIFRGLLVASCGRQGDR